MSYGLELGMMPRVVECDERPLEARFADAKRITDELLATLGHEMRNPLSALSHALTLWPSLQNDLVAMAELRGLMDRQVRQLTSMSDDLLDAARTVRGKYVLRRESIDLRRVLESACEQVRPFLEGRQHRLDVCLDRSPLIVYGDASRLVQVFANLVQNAAKFMERGGVVRVTAEPADGSAIVRVRDGGAGIDASCLASIFHGDSSAAASDARPNDGLGLGLRLVKTIVDLHGGAVEARSAGIGSGSEFIVQLPRVANVLVERPPPPDPGSAMSENAEAAPLLQRRIVVLDDDRSATMLLTRVLRSLGHSVVATNDGSAALDLVLKSRPEVVFLDLMMPGTDGCEAARQLRGHADTRDATLIALSGCGDDESKRRALDAGFDAYLVKPTSVADLTDALARFPSGWRCAAATVDRRRTAAGGWAQKQSHDSKRFSEDFEVSKASDYQLGDRVAAVSGGREMTVCQVSIDFSTEAESIECGWFENGIQRTARFGPDDLCRVGVAKSGMRPTATGFSASNEA